MEPITSSYIVFKGTYDVIHDVIDNITDVNQDRELIGFPTKYTILEISYRLLIHHSSCDILPPFPCHVLMTAIVHFQMD